MLHSLSKFFRFPALRFSAVLTKELKYGYKNCNAFCLSHRCRPMRRLIHEEYNIEKCDNIYGPIGVSDQQNSGTGAADGTSLLNY